MGGPWDLWLVALLAAPGPLVPACCQGGEGLCGSLADGCSVCDLTQLIGIVIGALLALALIGITIFFVYRRVNRFREYLASDFSSRGKGQGLGRVGGVFVTCLCFELLGAALRPVIAFVGNCWPVPTEAVHAGPMEFVYVPSFLGLHF